ncbi:SLC13 family permease [Pseudoscardovia suis]|uniref:SLC13 family permease n=1 Tax=Pseudoscardovia suis TaxID=987063 RepID=UPI003F948031
MRRKIADWLKDETVFAVALVLALASCFIVHPDAQYATYIHMNTIVQLLALMIVVCGWQRVGLFHIIGSKLLGRSHTERGLVLTLISLTFFSAMLITNDVALVTFVPFAISVLTMANMRQHTCLVVTLMTIGANVGSMLTPVGNAHNLYLHQLSGLSTAAFMGIMLPYSFAAAVLLTLIVCVVFGNRKLTNFDTVDSNDIERSVLAPSADMQPDEVRTMGFGGWRTWVYGVLFVICLLGVDGIVDKWLMLALVIVAMIVCDHRTLRHVDYFLPLTFSAFFVFIGNMRRVPQFYTIAASLVGSHPISLGVGFSQLISNVPTTLLLSGFSDAWRPLIIGTNLGGMGTLIASMASLISYKSVTRTYRREKGKYLLTYTGVNVLFLVVLLGLAAIIEPTGI